MIVSRLYNEKTSRRTRASRSRGDETLASGSWLVILRLLSGERFWHSHEPCEATTGSEISRPARAPLALARTRGQSGVNWMDFWIRSD